MSTPETLAGEALAEAVAAQRHFDAEIEREVFGRKVLGEAWVSPWHDMPGEYVDPRQEPGPYEERAWVYLGECHCVNYDNPFNDPAIFGHFWQCLEVCARYTEIEAAWRVVERLRALGFAVVVTVTSNTEQCEVHHPAFGRVAIDAPTAPEAICRAALAAVRAQKESAG